MLDIFILLAMTGASLWTVMTRSLLRSAIGLALTSIILTILMFRLNSPLAAVFELSVCAGLISVLFVSMISLTHILSKEQVLQHMRERLARFWFLPFLVIILLIVLSMLKFNFALQLPAAAVQNDVRMVLWHTREVDILGQIVILLMGVFGVLIFFKEIIKK